jgi:hypothetical protein
MELFIIVILIFIVFSSYMITKIIDSIGFIFVNLVILWFVLLRAYFEIRHKKNFYPYLEAFIITTILHLVWFEQIQVPVIFWPVWFVLIMFVLAEIIKLIPLPYRRWVERKAERAVNETKAIIKRL